MTEVALYETAAPALTAAPLPERVGVPGSQDFDSWTAVVVQVVKLAEHICDTAFVPDGLRGSAPAVAAAILAGREMGIAPMTSLANVDVIRGRPALKPVLMRALIQSRGHKWVDVDVSDVRVVLKGCRRGESDWAEVTFTAAQAKTAGIDLGKYPADKLYARASSRLAKRKFADVIMGMPYSTDEIEDGEDEDGTLQLAPAAAEAPKPAPRTAQRRQRTEAKPERPTASPGAPTAPAAASAASTASKAASPSTGPDLPPLPGEEDPTSAPTAKTQDAGPARPGTDEPPPVAPGRGEKQRRLVGIIHQHFKRLGFTPDERDQRLAATATIANREPITSTSDLNEAQLSVVADTLARCRDRDRLIALLAEGDKPDGHDG